MLFSRQAVFNPTVPATAAPTFVTSGVELAWSIRLEFGVVKATTAPQLSDTSDEAQDQPLEEEAAPLEPEEQNENEKTQGTVQLFEDVVKDERGVVSIAVERLECEGFEVSIPITVYGDIASSSGEKDDIQGIPI